MSNDPNYTVNQITELLPSIKSILQTTLSKNLTIDDEFNVTMNVESVNDQTEANNYEKLFKIKSALVFAAIVNGYDIIVEQPEKSSKSLQIINEENQIRYKTYHPEYGYSSVAECPALVSLYSLALQSTMALATELPIEKRITFMLEIANAAVNTTSTDFYSELVVLSNIIKKYSK